MCITISHLKSLMSVCWPRLSVLHLTGESPLLSLCDVMGQSFVFSSNFLKWDGDGDGDGDRHTRMHAHTHPHWSPVNKGTELHRGMPPPVHHLSGCHQDYDKTSSSDSGDIQTNQHMPTWQTDVAFKIWPMPVCISGPIWTHIWKAEPGYPQNDVVRCPTNITSTTFLP